MNVIAGLEFELAYYDSAVHRFNHYTARPPHVFSRALERSEILSRICIWVTDIISYDDNHPMKCSWNIFSVNLMVNSFILFFFIFFFLPLTQFSHPHIWYFVSAIIICWVLWKNKDNDMNNKQNIALAYINCQLIYLLNSLESIYMCLCN